METLHGRTAVASVLVFGRDSTVLCDSELQTLIHTYICLLHLMYVCMHIVIDGRVHQVVSNLGPVLGVGGLCDQLLLFSQSHGVVGISLSEPLVELPAVSK